MQEVVRIGLIGVGRIGQMYARLLSSEVEGVELVAVADARGEAAQAAAERHGIAVWSGDYQEVLSRNTVDAVVIATPTNTHVEVVKAAAAAKKQVFCEKPLALTVAGCDEAIQATDQAGVRLMVGLVRRYDMAYRQAKQKIEEGAIGRPVSYKGIGHDAKRTSLEFARRESSGGIIMDMGIHDFDMARWLMGDEVMRVHSEGACLVYPELAEVGDIDNAVINLKFANGAIGNIDLSRNAVYWFDTRSEVLGSEGGLRIGRDRQSDAIMTLRDGLAQDLMLQHQNRFRDAFLAEIRDFARCVREGTPPAVTGADARAATAIAEAAVRSLDEGRAVMVDEVMKAADQNG